MYLSFYTNLILKLKKLVCFSEKDFNERTEKVLEENLESERNESGIRDKSWTVRFNDYFLRYILLIKSDTQITHETSDFCTYSFDQKRRLNQLIR